MTVKQVHPLVVRMRDSQARFDRREGQRRPSPEFIDQQAENKFWRGYKKNRICPTCRVKMPVTGVCDEC